MFYVSAYRAPSHHLAKSALSLVLQHTAYFHHSPPSHSNNQPNLSADTQHNPLDVKVPVNEFGLPMTPLSTVPSVTHTLISSDALQKLHTLSALNPPPNGSAEETQLIEELGGLIGLMDIVKNVQLPGGPREEILRDLLGVGVGEITIGREQDTPKPTSPSEGQKNGKELLEWATRRVGDYYASRVATKN